MGKGMELMLWIISQLPELEKGFFAFRERRSNQTRAKERESPSLHLKAERSSMESLGALELNTCWEETDKDKTQPWKPVSDRAGRSRLSTVIWTYNKGLFENESNWKWKIKQVQQCKNKLHINLSGIQDQRKIKEQVMEMW